MISIFIRILRRLFWYFCFLLPVKKNKIVFQSYYGRGYSDNPKYIAEELMKKNDNIDFVWVVNDLDDSSLPDCFRRVKFRSFKYIYEISTAKVWVDNSRKEYCIKKKNQYYMQTWHGGFPLKRVEQAVESELEACYVKQAKRDAKQTDVMLSNCNALTQTYQEDFWYDGEVLQYGLPRNDRLFSVDELTIERIKDDLKIDKNIKLLLYAPTFRVDGTLSAYSIDYQRCCNALKKRFGGEWKILLKLHPNISSYADKMNFDESFVINVSHYPDIQELYMISDFLITDYSSVIFDFILLKRYSLIYASDLQDYLADRGFYRNIFDFPFDVCQNNDELESSILNFDEKRFLSNINGFLSEQQFADNGSASAVAANWILEHLSK